MTVKAKIGVMCPQTKECLGPREPGRGQEQTRPGASRLSKGCHLLDFVLQSCETMNFCCLGPASVWLFMAALGDRCANHSKFAILPDSMKAGEVVAQTGAKPNKPLDKFEEEQSNLHSDKKYIFFTDLSHSSALT